ncbi:MAG: hypothetical protein DMG07_17740, partial [Acidobacteria bacterium]
VLGGIGRKPRKDLDREIFRRHSRAIVGVEQSDREGGSLAEADRSLGGVYLKLYGMRSLGVKTGAEGQDQKMRQ